MEEWNRNIYSSPISIPIFYRSVLGRFRIGPKSNITLRPYLIVLCAGSSFKNSKRWQRLNSNLNPPLSPFCKGGIFSAGL